MSVGEGDSFGRQAFQMRCLRMGIAPKRVSPVIQVIDRDEENVRLLAQVVRCRFFTGATEGPAQ